LGGHSKHFSEYFNDKFMVSQDLSKKMAAQTTSIAVQADEELLPYKQESLDLIQSPLCLHWVNDLPGSLIQIRNCLKPDGLFLAAFLGGETLTELRQAFLKTEMNILGGVRPHVSPFIGVKEAGALMQRAGFTIPVINIERITVTYSDAFALMKELKAMGESNALIKRYKGLTSPKIMLEMARNYHEMFANDKGRIPATFDIVYVQGWAPHDSQQKPLKPGSAKVSLTKILGQEPPNSN
jgi:NADH dehydrogenase [ubiquinone] 1 alpha subcomplex assembly factor 5